MIKSQRPYLWLFTATMAIFVIVALNTGGVTAATIQVEKTLHQALAQANAGDTLILGDSTYNGPIVISKPLRLIGSGATIIAGNNSGSVITVKSADVTIRGIVVTGSGLSLESQDSGIFLDKTATNAVIEKNVILNNLIGIYVSGAKNSLVKDNHIQGRQDLRTNERGNGVQIWNAPGTVIEGNQIEFGRDGIFVTTSSNNIFRFNRMTNLRFAVHYMYTNHSQIIGNYSENNHIGFALMSSNNLIVRGNASRHDRDRGFLFNYANNVQVEENVVSGGTEKCIFIYNSNKNSFTRNLLSGCLIGVHFTAGSERNILSENAFVNNQTQVKYVGTRWLEWSHNGIGNYWSDHVAFDLDENGIADSIYRPNDLTDQVIWKYPSARLLMNSPAVQVLKYAQNTFPALHPGGVVDSAPLMRMPSLVTEKVQQ